MDLGQDARPPVDALKRSGSTALYCAWAGKLEEVSWYDAFSEIAMRISKASRKGVGAIAGDLCTVEEMFALKALLDKLGSPHRDCRRSAQAGSEARARELLCSTPPLPAWTRRTAIL